MQFCVLNSTEQLGVEFVFQDKSPDSLIPVVFWFYILDVLCREQTARSSSTSTGVH